MSPERFVFIYMYLADHAKTHQMMATFATTVIVHL